MVIWLLVLTVVLVRNEKQYIAMLTPFLSILKVFILYISFQLSKLYKKTG